MADISKITTLDGTTYNVKDATARSSIPAAATATPRMDDTAAVGTATKYAREDHVHPSDTSRVKVAGDTMTGDLLRDVSSGTVLKVATTSFYQSPFPKYLWHDLFAFCRIATPSYYTTTDGSTWTAATLQKNLFAHKEAWGMQSVITSSIAGSRWVWYTNGALHACSASWLILGIGYAGTIAKFDVLLEQSADNSTWTTLSSASNINNSSAPIWIKTNGAVNEKYIRLTITKNSSSAASASLPITAIRWLTPRWGNQGYGSEYEYPYSWDSSYNISPLSGAKFVGDTQTSKLYAPSSSGGSSYTVGSSGQVLKSNGTTVYWGDVTITVPSAATATPSALGTPAVGTSTKYAREDHVHQKPSYTAADVGAIAAPSSPATGSFLVYNGTSWVAQTLSTWQGGNY